MKVEIFHASKYGNGEKVAAYVQGALVAKGHQADFHHVKQSRPKELPPADLYVFLSPTRIGKPIGGMRRFLKKASLPAGAKYAIVATYVRPRPNKKTGEMPTEEEVSKYQRTLAVMDEMLAAKGGSKVAEAKVFVVDMKGPLEEGWEKEAQSLVARLGA